MLACARFFILSSPYAPPFHWALGITTTIHLDKSILVGMMQGKTGVSSYFHVKQVTESTVHSIAQVYMSSLRAGDQVAVGSVCTAYTSCRDARCNFTLRILVGDRTNHRSRM